MISMTLAILLAQVSVAAATAPPTVDLGGLSECEDSLSVAIFNVPRYPHRGAPLRILIVSEEDLGQTTVIGHGPDGATRTFAAEPYGGPPFGWVVEVAKPELGEWRFALVNAGGVQSCQDVTVRRHAWGNNRLKIGEDSVWRPRIKWERDTENLYSLWIEALFVAPLDEDVSWNPLSKVIKDDRRNLLYGYMGLDEDKDGLGLAPDCADFPYYLRGYFAWKLGLPFTYRPCRRGNAKRAPTCGDLRSNDVLAEAATRTGSFQTFMKKVKGTVHSSSLRSLPRDEASDFYPVRLDRRGLRPGTIYADPYGHTMMVGRWYPQTEERAGVLMAIDAQPDGTIGRRVFWRGSFMFPKDDSLAGAGWKRFRPIRKTRDGIEALSNKEISASVDYGDFSVEQWEAGQEGFYEKMDRVINPKPMSPERALVAAIDALDQQLRRRVESVENGEGWKRDHAGKTMKMPKGGAIFITSGPWEDYSTPARDMRLLIAMDTVLNFPARVARYPARFVLVEGVTPAQAKAALEAQTAREANTRTFIYKRSDGTPWTLTLQDILSRSEAFEMSYNPNDCVERRWAAPEGSDERATCKTQAPKAQRKKMVSYRRWFERRERPVH
ncbi:MAG: hypothetical protein ACI9MR_000215 [Myxococcota bacterium]|jgi:hypothetical protein